VLYNFGTTVLTWPCSGTGGMVQLQKVTLVVSTNLLDASKVLL
jgi:hypothetical protein